MPELPEWLSSSGQVAVEFTDVTVTLTACRGELTCEGVL